MKKSDIRYQTFVNIMKEELAPAMGCTEPISLAFAAAKAREVLGCMPKRVHIEASGNIIKNVKSVVVPNTGGRRGMEIAAAAGIIAGKPEKELEVIAEATEEQKEEMDRFAKSGAITVSLAKSDLKFDIVVRMSAGEESAVCRVAVNHTNIVYLEKNGKALIDLGEPKSNFDGMSSGRELLNVKDIVEFADTVDLEDVRPLLERQVKYNSAIAQEGLRGNYGAKVGSTLLKCCGDSVRIRARAYAAAGSDARMNGCELPVVINSGSGNQGITSTMPVVIYAKELGVSEEKLFRALIVSDLITDHQKTYIGVLSAYCGAMTAGVGAACGVAYLYGENAEMIGNVLINGTATLSGVICDGAKASCASKIATAVEMGLLGYDMAKNGQVLQAGDGIVGATVEETIRNVGRLADEGMRDTDKTILHIMVGSVD